MRFLKILTLCFLLTACVFGTSQTSKFYTLASEPSPSISNSCKSFVGVVRVQLPKYMDRPQIATQNKNSPEIVISEYNRWVENPSVLMTRVLVEDLSALLPSAQIKMNQYGLEQFDRVISVEVVKMNAILGDQAELVAWYTIKNKSGQTLIRNKFADSVQIGKSYDDLANGYGQLLTRLSQNIAHALIKK
ncbi:MAG: PqiC family protein [Pseudomonadota bacterium]|nr:PqiC family protein [Pseudomonadota bacterium]